MCFILQLVVVTQATLSRHNMDVVMFSLVIHCLPSVIFRLIVCIMNLLLNNFILTCKRFFNVQGVPQYCSHFVFVIFPGSGARTEELLTFIQQPLKFAT